MESGLLAEKYPFVRFGKGEEKIVLFPPLTDALIDVTAVPWYLQCLFHYFSRDYTVYAVSRRRNLPVGYSTQDMARDYAGALEAIGGPAHLIGISLGGMIAQLFTVEFPHYVKQLVLVASSYHMGLEGLAIARRWIPWARRLRWREIYEDMISLTYSKNHVVLPRLLKGVIERYLVAKVKDPTDFIVSGQAAIIHDAFEWLSKIKVPTLIIGGEQDKFFPQKVFEEMVQKIPHARLMLVKNVGHGVYEECRRQCVRAILSFMRDSTSKGRWRPAPKVSEIA
jgi:pimeloyl-ACP methyl ester carboxylesterase